MRAIIGARLLASSAAQPKDRPFEINDRRLPGFVLRVQPSGVRSFYVQLSRGRRLALGKVGHRTAEEARHRCELVLGNIAHGREPTAGLSGIAPETFGQFIQTHYSPWAIANRPRSAKSSLARIKRCFVKWNERPLTSISTAQVESWKTDRLHAGIRPATVLRDLASLSAVLSRAVRMDKLPDNPVRRVEKPRLDRTPKVRFLDPEEEARLRAALADRDVRLRQGRDSANAWRRRRHCDTLPRLPHFGDHMTPAVLISLNTGLRRGELLALRWSDVNFRQFVLSVQAASAKTGQTRHVPLNTEAVEALKHWREQNPDAGVTDQVFTVTTSFKTAWSSILTSAGITRFRWHDLRHHFASRLVQADVNLNTVRELLGHGSLAMTLRYAHLGPDQKRNAVALLVIRAPETAASQDPPLTPPDTEPGRSPTRERAHPSVPWTTGNAARQAGMTAA